MMLSPRGRDAIARQFASLGMTPHDAASRADLFVQLATHTDGLLDGEPDWWRFTPGRIEIFGKHTDYAGGHSLLAAVPRGIALAARRRRDGLVRVADVFDGQRIEIDPSTPAQADYRGLKRYIHVVAHRLFLNFPGCELGTNIAFGSDLARASGMSSSSALTVGVALTLIERAGLREREEWKAHLRTIEDVAWYLGCVENGLDFPGLPGSAGVGTQGGSQDQTAIVACTTDRVSLYRFVPVTAMGTTAMPPDWMFVIASSGIQADKAGSVMHLYNRASSGARALLETWNRHAAPAASLADAVRSHPGAADRLRGWLTPTSDGAFSVAELDRRLTHFMRETARGPEAAAAFARADRDALGQLSAASQHDAEHLLGNQIQETVLMAALAREHGAFASSSFGAGFGGSVWAAVGRDEAEQFGEAWIRAYQAAVPSVGQVPWFVARPGPPATEVAPA